MRGTLLLCALALIVIGMPGEPAAAQAGCGAAHCLYLPLTPDDPPLRLSGLLVDSTLVPKEPPRYFLSVGVSNPTHVAFCDVRVGFRAELAEPLEGESTLSVVLPGEQTGLWLADLGEFAAAEVPGEARLLGWRGERCGYALLTLVEQRIDGRYVGYGYSVTVTNTLRNDTPHTLRELSTCRPQVGGAPSCPLETAALAPGQTLTYSYWTYVVSPPELPVGPQPSWMIGRYE